MKRICVDMDEVLADTLAEHIFRYNRDHSEAITKADLEGKWFWQVVSADRHDGCRPAKDFICGKANRVAWLPSHPQVVLHTRGG